GFHALSRASVVGTVRYRPHLLRLVGCFHALSRASVVGTGALLFQSSGGDWAPFPCALSRIGSWDMSPPKPGRVVCKPPTFPCALSRIGSWDRMQAKAGVQVTPIRFPCALSRIGSWDESRQMTVYIPSGFH